ncbi:MAG: replicative DNA helicase [Chloroflexi bacterium]|nr:replicative DNA helicase [Chloroflexota bacterium]
MYQDRLPPHDVEAEEAVLGSLLLDEEVVFKLASFLRPQDFFREKNRWAFEACLALYDRREPINQITLAHELATADHLEDLGGHAYLSYLVTAVPTSVFAEQYAQIVHRTATLRRLIDAAGQIAALGYEGGPDADAVLDKAEDILFHLRTGRSPQDFEHIREVIDRYLRGEGAEENREARIPRILTGFERLDRVLGGLHRSDLVIIAARPGLGKTSLALNMAYHAAVKQRAHVAIFSVEMAKDQLVERLLSGEAGVDVQRLRLGHIDPKYLTQEEEVRIIESTGILSDAPIYIDDTPIISALEIRSKARRLHYDVGLDMVIVDYMQLITDGGSSDYRSQQNRVQQMAEISRALKGLARELHVPVLALSQLSRAVEARHPHIPQLADLRDSGSIEQDADVVAFIYREDAYFTKEAWEQHYPTRRYPEGIAKIIIAKHRNGPTGDVDLYFQKKTARFYDLAAPGVQPPEVFPPA